MGGSCKEERGLVETSSFPCTPWSPSEGSIVCSSLLSFSFPPSHRCSHDGAALGFLFAERGGEHLRLAGEEQESLGEAAVRAGFIGRLEFAHACQSSSTENTVDALL